MKRLHPAWLLFALVPFMLGATITTIPLTVDTADPGGACTPSNGIWFNTTTSRAWFCPVTTWVRVAGSDEAGGSFDGSITAQFSLQGDTSPSNLTADADNFDCNLDTTTICRVTGDTSFRAIRGLADSADGRKATLCNVGANTLLLPDQGNTVLRASTAGNRFALSGYDVPLWPGVCLDFYYDSTTSRWRLIGNALQLVTSVPTQNGIYARDAGSPSTSVAASPIGFISSINGAGASFIYTISSDDDDPGAVAVANAGTTTTGRSTQIGQTTQLRLGNSLYQGLKQRMRLPTLSDGTETYSYRWGFMDSGSADPVDGCFFRYTHSVNSGNWELVCRSNSAETVTNASVGPAANTWTTIAVVIYPAGPTAEFFVDGVSAGTVTTNIPTGASRQTAIGWFILKSAGTTTRTAENRSTEWFFWDNVPN